MSFKVIKVLDGDTFEVSPNWQWNNNSGSIVRPLGYDAPELGTTGSYEAKTRLEGLVLNQNVELKGAVKLTYARLLCKVFVNNIDVASYIKQYQN